MNQLRLYIIFYILNGYGYFKEKDYIQLLHIKQYKGYNLVRNREIFVSYIAHTC